MSALHDLSAVEQGAAVRRGEVSPRELAAHYLARSDEVGAFVTRTPELALTRAEALLPVPEGAGPLYGVPTAIKDLNLTAGVRTTFGSAAFADFVPEVSESSSPPQPAVMDRARAMIGTACSERVRIDRY